MATIKPNDKAPQEAFKVILPTETLENFPHETDDRVVLADAEAHPWLEVEYPEVEELAQLRTSSHVPYEEDYLAAHNSKAFDAEAVKAALVEDAAVVHTAVEAGLDQSKEEKVADTNVTLAADAAATENADKDEKPARKSGGKGDKD